MLNCIEIRFVDEYTSVSYKTVKAYSTQSPPRGAYAQAIEKKRSRTVAAIAPRPVPSVLPAPGATRLSGGSVGCRRQRGGASDQPSGLCRTGDPAQGTHPHARSVAG